MHTRQCTFWSNAAFLKTKASVFVTLIKQSELCIHTESVSLHPQSILMRLNDHKLTCFAVVAENKEDLIFHRVLVLCCCRDAVSVQRRQLSYWWASSSKMIIWPVVRSWRRNVWNMASCLWISLQLFVAAKLIIGASWMTLHQQISQSRKHSCRQVPMRQRWFD